MDDSRTGLEGAGDDVWVKAMEENKQLFEKVRKALKDAAEDLYHKMHMKARLISATPGHILWSCYPL